MQAALGFDAFHLAEVLLTQPLQVIVGNAPGAFGSYRDGFELFNRARSDNKNDFAVAGASHYDLYDQPKYTTQALEKLESFFEENL
ncbi:alpha/beta hydrolase [Streptomyces cadmiisoli]|uniref:alpha/beta hydrolase n=1 Tax=Streptomyces cadmiisoli TaxID=2184053 RepID=UPI001FE48956|nr:alpha/beta hydrolase [Streptomyces cadmiisoli]